MFLISWRGYWQELIETLVWAHEKTPSAAALAATSAHAAASAKAYAQGR
jgi:hypothetical protein